MLPENTRFVAFHNREPVSRNRPDYTVFAAHRAFDIARALRDPKLDPVVVHLGRRSPWSFTNFRTGLRLDKKTEWRSRFWRAFAPLVPLLGTSAPIIGVDFDDSPFVPPHMLSIIRRSVVTFKRELPPDRWLMLAFQFGEQVLPGMGQRRQERLRAVLDKFEPISLGIEPSMHGLLPSAPLAKKTDVFFAGNFMDNASIRIRSLDEIRGLAAEGFVIDMPDRLPPQEFVRRCAEARLVLSPQGYGWDCYRHYEAAACWSVPLMSQCTIERHARAEHGIHAFYYDADHGALARMARAALSDKPRLAQMATAAHAHFSAHHTHLALCRHMIAVAAEKLMKQSTSESPRSN